MVKGIDTFKEYFAGFEAHYVIIGGTACEQQFAEVGLAFRATKDIDMVLVIEALDGGFVARFWQFIADGGYAQTQVDAAARKYYRFAKPADDTFPAMLELFSRKPDIITEKPGMYLTPIPAADDLSSLSAILMDEAYYQFTTRHSQLLDGLRVASTEALICLKATAWLDMKARKETGEAIDARNISKHKNDVIRLVVTLTGEKTVECPERIKADLRRYLDLVTAEPPDVAQLTGTRVSLTDINELIAHTFQLQNP